MFIGKRFIFIYVFLNQHFFVCQIVVRSVFILLVNCLNAVVSKRKHGSMESSTELIFNSIFYIIYEFILGSYFYPQSGRLKRHYHA